MAYPLAYRDHDFSFSVVYVCGERSGIIAEDSFQIDESFNETSKLDITTEKKPVEETSFKPTSS